MTKEEFAVVKSRAMANVVKSAVAKAGLTEREQKMLEDVTRLHADQYPLASTASRCEFMLSVIDVLLSRR